MEQIIEPADSDAPIPAVPERRNLLETLLKTSQKRRASKTSRSREPYHGFVQKNATQVVVVPQPSCSSIPMISLCLGGELIDIPQALVEDENILRSVVNKFVFSSLSSQCQQYLKRFLPLSNVDSTDEFEKVLDYAFSKDNIFFDDNPISKFIFKIQCGHFTTQYVTNELHLRTHRRVLYDHYIRSYYIKTIKRVLVNRQIILEAAASSPDGTLQHPFNFYSKRKMKNSKAIAERAAVRARRMINEVKRRAGDKSEALSSDDDEDEEIASIKPMELAEGAESTLYSKENSFNDLDLYQPIRSKDTTDLLREYRHLCEAEPDCPSSDITGVALEDLYERAGLSFQSERNFATSLFTNSNRVHNRNRRATNGVQMPAPAAITNGAVNCEPGEESMENEE